MPSYIVERYVPGLTPVQVVAAATRVKRASARLTEEGVRVRYLRSTYVPEDETCFDLFEGRDEAAVRKANERADVSFERIVEAVDVSAEELG